MTPLGKRAKASRRREVWRLRSGLAVDAGGEIAQVVAMAWAGGGHACQIVAPRHERGHCNLLRRRRAGDRETERALQASLKDEADNAAKDRDTRFAALTAQLEQTAADLGDAKTDRHSLADLLDQLSAGLRNSH